jgi:predicted nucleotide-binding protein
MPRLRPIVFVGSSSEARNIAQTFCTVLSDTADIMPWWLSPEFGVMQNTLDSLIKAADKYDFGLFVFAPDDMIESRGQKEMSTRDNVLFELGLFLGRLGADRTFAVIQGAQSKIDQIKIPSDLLGIHIPRYTYLSDSGLIASVNNAAVSIREAIQRRWKKDRKLKLAKGWHHDNENELFSILRFSIACYGVTA